jgi:hypothetical protein
MTVQDLERRIGGFQVLTIRPALMIIVVLRCLRFEDNRGRRVWWWRQRRILFIRNCKSDDSLRLFPKGGGWAIQQALLPGQQS